MFFILAGVHIHAQQEGKVIAEIAAGNGRAIKNAPFSADAVSESVQVLADGNRIVRSSTSKLYRNSEGRFRREGKIGSGGFGSTLFSYGEGISIMDPVAGHRVMLNSLEKTARLVELNAGQNVAIAGRAAIAKELSETDRAQIEEKIKSAQNLNSKEREEMLERVRTARTRLEGVEGVTAIARQAPAMAAAIDATAGAYVYSTGGSHGKYETRKEDLGTRDFEGVSAEGVRRTTIIPEGAIGNERPIEIVYESWHSKELGLVVYSEHSDPRFGKQTYRVTNIVRAEPDPSLFSVPHGYKVLAEPAPVFHLSTKPTTTAQSATTVRPASAPKPATVVNVKGTKP